MTTKAETLELGELLGPTGGGVKPWAPIGPFLVPLEIATQTIGILGQKGSGKSNTEVRLAELFWEANIPWVAVDPKGDWWGIRSSESGDEPGLEVPILGGLHGDIPLGVDEGAHWADVIVDINLTAVLDVSDFSKGERARFLVAFFDRLYRRHRQDPQVRHIFLEEAHEYIPQQVGREDGRLKEAAARIVLQGRTFGLGASACSQRSAQLPPPPPAPARAPAPRARIKDADELPAGARKILDVAVASYPVRLTRAQLGTFAGYSQKSSTWDGHMAALRRGGFLVLEGKEVVVTELGLATSDAAPSAPTSPAERMAMWTSKLKDGPAKILRVLVAAGPAGLTIPEVGERTGYSTTSSTFDGHLATLRRNGLTTTTAGVVRASEDLYG